MLLQSFQCNLLGTVCDFFRVPYCTRSCRVRCMARYVGARDARIPKPPGSQKSHGAFTIFRCGTASSQTNSIWPKMAEILLIQAKFNSPQASIILIRLIKVDYLVWIPHEADDLKQRLRTIAHAGAASHGGVDLTSHYLKKKFFWKAQLTDVQAHVSDRPLCLLNKTGKKIFRPSATTARPLSLNNIIHFDYIFLGNSSNLQDLMKYVLVIKDNVSGCCWLQPFL